MSNYDNIEQVAGMVLDYIMNQGSVQQMADKYVADMYPNVSFDCPENVDEAEWEQSVNTHLYEATVSEFYAKVLAQAMSKLVNLP